jgi:glutaredoxin 3
MNKKVELYTTPYCPYCRRALKLLDDKGVTYTNHDVSNNRPLFESIMSQTGWDTVPQIFIDDQFIGGCDDMHALDRKGTLDGLLGLI